MEIFLITIRFLRLWGFDYARGFAQIFRADVTQMFHTDVTQKVHLKNSEINVKKSA